MAANTNRLARPPDYKSTKPGTKVRVISNGLISKSKLLRPDERLALEVHRNKGGKGPITVKIPTSSSNTDQPRPKVKPRSRASLGYAKTPGQRVRARKSTGTRVYRQITQPGESCGTAVNVSSNESPLKRARVRRSSGPIIGHQHPRSSIDEGVASSTMTHPTPKASPAGPDVVVVSTALTPPPSSIADPVTTPNTSESIPRMIPSQPPVDCPSSSIPSSQSGQGKSSAPESSDTDKVAGDGGTDVRDRLFRFLGSITKSTREAFDQEYQAGLQMGLEEARKRQVSMSSALLSANLQLQQSEKRTRDELKALTDQIGSMKYEQKASTASIGQLRASVRELGVQCAAHEGTIKSQYEKLGEARRTIERLQREQQGQTTREDQLKADLRRYLPIPDMAEALVSKLWPA